MSVDCLKNFSLEDVRKARIDYTSSGSTTFGLYEPELLGERCTVLQPDKIRFGDKSTTGSPISSHRGSSVHHDSAGSSASDSPIASPISYTQDLIGVDSPGLSGGAGALTPVETGQKARAVAGGLATPPTLTTKSTELLLQPRSVMLTAEPAPQPPPLPPRKSRFDMRPEDMEVDAKPSIGPSVPPSRNKRKLEASSEEEQQGDGSDEKEEPADPRKMGSLGSVVKRIKLETLSTTATTKPSDYKQQQPLPPLASPPSLVAIPEGALIKPRAPPPPLVPRAVATAAAAARPPVPPTPPPKPQTAAKAREDQAPQARTQEPPKKKQQQSKGLVEYEGSSEEDDDSDEEEDEDETALPPPSFGPQLPKSNGVLKPAQPATAAVNGVPTPKKPIARDSSTTSLVTTGAAAAAATTAATTGAAASVAKSNRKRLLSERGEKELSYPVIEKEISNKWGWDGAAWLNERKRGQGLINRANDCFLNVILQMITHTAPLARYLMERHKTDCKRESPQCVACAVRDHHLQRTFRANGPMETRWIGQHLRRIFPSHSFGMQEDAHELLSLLLDAIDPPPGWNREAGNKELPTNKLKPSTPVEQIFGGTLRNQVTCQQCHTPYINYERIRELNVALGRKQDYFKNETIAAFSCKKYVCARKTQAVRQTRVLKAPAVLIVQLKRFNAYGGKIRQPIAAEKELDLGKFTYDGIVPEGEGGGGKKAVYALTGVVEHLGSTVRFGDDLLDDIVVSRIQTYSQNPYLLFYSRKDLQPKMKNGQVNGAASVPSTSKLVPSINNGNGMKMNGNGRPMMGGATSSSGQNNVSHLNGVVARPPIPMGGGAYVKQFQNGAGPSKSYGSNNGYGNGGNKFSGSNGYGGNKYNNNGHNNSQYSSTKHWNGGGGGGGSRPIKTFQKFSWNGHQRI
ncbi:hypothetical protein PRIPAC_75165 [Pristionchus pacificus]|uniref:Ubiquitin carboxyl-terminal hydrolase 36 n=1 Tax=Pristionchus pacificus TaxID=54126 RepID=A0A2A6BEP1_PRIPA|nr:hypothetical protein PRIPAC_75165 [Pristionchus pacificus]|eukprot:PDM64370.1 Peptidase [Pristionchus pacificus]